MRVSTKFAFAVGRAPLTTTYSVLRRLHSKPDNEFGFENRGRDVPPLACTFFPGASQRNLVAVADEDGRISLFDTGPERVSKLTSWAAHENAVFEVAVRPWYGHLATACGDLSIALWDVSKRQKVASFQAHTGSVKCVCFSLHSPDIFASGGRDGTVLVWDVRCTRPAMKIPKAHVTTTRNCKKARNCSKEVRASTTNSVTACVFQDDHQLVSCGATNSVIKVWDMRKNYELYKPYPQPVKYFPYAGDSPAIHGYTCLRLSGSSLYASCTDSRIYHFNAASYDSVPVGQFVGHNVGSFYVKMDLSPDRQFLLSGSSDGNAYVWNVHEPGPPRLRLSGHTAEVSALAWHPWDISRVVTCGDDHKVLFWDAAGEGEGASGRCEPVAAPSPPVSMTPDATNGACGRNSMLPKQVTPKTPRRSKRDSPSLTDWLTPSFKQMLHNGEQATKELSTPPRPVDCPAEPPSATLSHKSKKTGHQTVPAQNTPNQGQATGKEGPDRQHQHYAHHLLL